MQKLFPLGKMVKKHGGVLIYLKVDRDIILFWSSLLQGRHFYKGDNYNTSVFSSRVGEFLLQIGYS